MKKSSNVNEEITERSDAKDAVLKQPAAAEVPQEANAAESEHAMKLKAAQDKAAQLMQEQRYDEAKRVLKEAENLQVEEAKTQPIAEADHAARLAAAQDKVTQLMREQ